MVVGHGKVKVSGAWLHVIHVELGIERLGESNAALVRTELRIIHYKEAMERLRF